MICERCLTEPAEFDTLCGGCAQDLHDEVQADRSAAEHDALVASGEYVPAADTEEIPF